MESVTEQVVQVKFTNDYDSVKLAERLITRVDHLLIPCRCNRKNGTLNTTMNYIEDADGRHYVSSD